MPITSNPNNAKTMCPHCLALNSVPAALSEQGFEDGTVDRIMECEGCGGHYVETEDKNRSFLDRAKLHLYEDEYGDPVWIYSDTGKQIR